MDILPFASLVRSVAPNKEPYMDYGMTTGQIVNFVIGIIIGALGAYISWNTNTLMTEGFDYVLRVVFAIFAFLFSYLYLVVKLIINSDARQIVKDLFQAAKDKVTGSSSNSTYSQI